MKRILIYIAIITFTMEISSCSKDDNAQAFNPLDKLLTFREAGIEPDIVLSFVSNGNAFTDELGLIEATGEFKNPSGNPANVDSFKIGGLKIPQVHRTGFYNKVYGQNSQIETLTGAALFGTTIDYDVFGSYPMITFDESYYLPEIVNLILYSHDGEIDVTQNLTVTWNADLYNEEDVNIGLFFVPRGQIIEDVVYKVYNTEDDGSYTIPSTDLDDFPVGYTIQLGIARGFADDVELDTDYHVRISGITYEMSEDILLID